MLSEVASDFASLIYVQRARTVKRAGPQRLFILDERRTTHEATLKDTKAEDTEFVLFSVASCGRFVT